MKNSGEVMQLTVVPEFHYNLKQVKNLHEMFRWRWKWKLLLQKIFVETCASVYMQIKLATRKTHFSYQKREWNVKYG